MGEATGATAPASRFAPQAERRSQQRASRSPSARSTARAERGTGPGGEQEALGQPAHRTGGKRQRPEELLQIAQVEFLRVALVAPWKFLHIPNQKGTRATWENRLLKALGVQEGAADILFLGPPNRFVWIENKSEKGRLSEAQEGWRDWCLSIGAQWYLCRSVEDLIAACNDAGIPLRVRQ